MGYLYIYTSICLSIYTTYICMYSLYISLSDMSKQATYVQFELSSLCPDFRERTLPGQERAWYPWHRTHSNSLRVFDYLLSNLLTDDPHYLHGTQVRHILRRIKCVWRLSGSTRPQRTGGERLEEGGATNRIPLNVRVWRNYIYLTSSIVDVISPAHRGSIQCWMVIKQHNSLKRQQFCFFLSYPKGY